ncbi:MFS transporter, partial [Streptomyces caniscabiei]|uniref:MFS transporter n=1 Tax=Streptomyces caniscabiei TaxID=2746961 RepID=UPI00117FECC4
GAYGAGSMAVALALPRVLDRVPDRAVMLPGALSLAVVFAGLGVVTGAHGGSWRLPGLLVLWAAFGAACSAVLTPTGRLVRRSVAPGERTAAFAAQFSLSHGCWLLTYPLAGWLGAAAGLNWAVLALGSLALGGALLAVRLWPAATTADAAHVHADLPAGHPHLVGARRVPTGWWHTHDDLTDGLHAR